MKRCCSLGGFVRLPVLWIILAAAVVAAGAIVSFWRMGEADLFMREELSRQTRLLAETIPPDQIRALSGTEDDLSRPEYLRFKKQFRSALQAFPGSKFLTLVGRREDGTVFFYADSELPGSEDESPPGDVYEEMDPGFLPAFEEQRPVTVGPITDRWGTWVSTWHPIPDPKTGRVFAALALDISGDNWNKYVRGAAVLPFGTGLALAAVLLGGCLALRLRSGLQGDERWRLRHIEAVCALTAGLILTFSVSRLVHERENLDRRYSFSVISDARSAELNNLFDNLRGVALESLGRYMESSEDVRGEEFDEFVRHIVSLPEVESAAWITAGEKPAVFSVRYRYPSARADNSEAYGGNAEALALAAATGLPAAGSIRSHSDRNGARHSLCVFRPVYRQGEGLPLLRGFVALSLRLDTIVNKAQRGGEGDAAMRLWELGPDGPRLAAGPVSPDLPDRFTGSSVSPGQPLNGVRPVFAFGRTFCAELHPGPLFRVHHPVRAGAMSFVSSLFITLAVTVLLGNAVHGREVLERVVAGRTAELRESEARFRSLVEDVPFPVSVISPEGRVLFTNSRGEEFFGIQSARTTGKHLLTELHILVNPGAFPGFVDQVFASGSLHGREVPFRSPEGDVRWAFLSANRILFDGRESIIVALQDITERKAMIDRLQLADQFFRTTTEGIVVTDADGFIEDGNPALEDLTGYSLEEIRGRRPGMFSAQRIHSETSERFWDSLRRNGVWQGEVWNRRKDGEAYPVWLTVTAVRDSEGKTTHYAGVLTHIGDIKTEQQRLSHMAYHDSLTGLPNRYLLLDRLEMVIARARREETFAAAVFIDLDEFKEVNDTYGHETGDLLLVSVARRLTEAVRDQDTVARLGGDEFVLVLDGFVSRDEVESFLERLKNAFSEPFSAGGRLLAVRGSMGIALFPDDGSTAPELLARADDEMYVRKGKRGGRRFF